MLNNAIMEPKKSTAILSNPFAQDDSQLPAGKIHFPENGLLKLEFVLEAAPVTLSIGSREIVLGRRDPSLPVQPDLDLSAVAGYRMGVSRRHAKIQRRPEGHLVLVDLGSPNGTFLNETRLPPHHAYRLFDGVKVALGQLEFYLRYPE